MNAARAELRYRYAFAAMGTSCEILVEGCDEAHATEAARHAIAEVARLDAKYSHYDDDSELARLTRAAERGRVEVDDETAALLDFAASLHAESGGLFDVAIGALTALWNRGRTTPPAAVEIARASAASGWSRVSWERPCLSVEPGTRFDLGGLVKEYAADRAGAVLSEHAVAHGLVELGGDVAVTGTRANGEAWLVGVRDPADPARAMIDVPLSSGGLATSGDYARGWTHAGRHYGHGIDPGRGVPVAGVASVTVLAPSCLVAGALATVAMLAGPADGARWLAASGARWFMADREGRIGAGTAASL